MAISSCQNEIVQLVPSKAKESSSFLAKGGDSLNNSDRSFNANMKKRRFERRKESLVGKDKTRKIPKCEACRNNLAVFELHWLLGGPSFFCKSCIKIYKIEKAISRSLV